MIYSMRIDCFFFSSRRRHTRYWRDWSSDVCSSDLGEAGATVYCTGRSTRAARRERGTATSPFSLQHRPETIEETAEMVQAQGGTGIAVRVDHTVEQEVQALFDQVRDEQRRLDVLVNDVWGGDELTEWG